MDRWLVIMTLLALAVGLTGCEENPDFFITGGVDECPNEDGVYCMFLVTENNTPTNVTFMIENDTEFNYTVYL